MKARFGAALRVIRRLRSLTLLVLAGAGATPLHAQVEETAVLEGTAWLGDAPLQDGTVVLHHLTDASRGDLDSVRVADDGRFRFTLPNVPNPARQDVFFASVRHHGVLYFGPMITAAAQLDSVYEVHAYDTLLAPAGGRAVPLQTRTMFFEPDSASWRVTDLFQLRNDEPRTIVARGDGYVWRHPLPEGIRDVETGQGELAEDAARFVDGELVARAALPPGERIFVIRYRIDSPATEIPVVAGTEGMDVLIREPAPPFEVSGLELVERIELEEGSTYRRFATTSVEGPAVRITPVEEVAPPRVEWAAVLLAMILAAAGVLILKPRATPNPVTEPADRAALLREIAQLDEDFEAGPRSDEARVAYERRRAELLRRVRALG